jgi:2-phospho-L-lactate guanylyltransferase
MNDPDQTAAVRPVWAAVPFKGQIGSKRRLSPLLDASERARLSVAMLDDVLDVLLSAHEIERVMVLTPGGDDNVPIHADTRLAVIDEPTAESGTGAHDQLNRAVEHAQLVAEARGAGGLLIVPSDLPLIDRADLRALLMAARTAPVVIAPDRERTGTNALLLVPPVALAPRFGELSFDRHRRLATEAGLAHTVVERPGLALDLDRPEDIGRLLTVGRGGRAVGLLRDLDIEQRLKQVELTQARSTTI